MVVNSVNSRFAVFQISNIKFSIDILLLYLANIIFVYLDRFQFDEFIRIDRNEIYF